MEESWSVDRAPLVCDFLRRDSGFDGTNSGQTKFFTSMNGIGANHFNK